MQVHIRAAVPDDLPQVHEMMGLLAGHHGEDRSISLTDLQAQVGSAPIGPTLARSQPTAAWGWKRCNTGQGSRSNWRDRRTFPPCALAHHGGSTSPG